MKTLYLFRHAAPERVPGLANEALPLSRRGREDMAALLEGLALPTGMAVYASPYRRARETAQVLGQPPVIYPRLGERETGSREAFTKEIWAGQYADPELRGPGGESFSQVRRRMEAALEDILRQTPEGGAAALVSHAGAICAYLQGFCTVEVTDPDRKARRIIFRDALVWEGPIPMPACFRLSFREERVEAVAFVGPEGPIATAEKP